MVEDGAPEEDSGEMEMGRSTVISSPCGVPDQRKPLRQQGRIFSVDILVSCVMR